MSIDRASYRRYPGEAVVPRFRFAAIATSGIRSAFKGKLALFLLFIIPGGWTVVFSFNVYTKFALDQGGSELAGVPMNPVMSLASQMIEIRVMVFRYFWVSRLFGLLVIAWYAAGLLAEDRRHGAHLLYFARPLSRADYLLGKFLTAFAFGTLVILVPGLFICGTAAFSSPEWSWLEEEPEVIWGTICYGLIATSYYALLVLAVSSVVKRRAYALVGVFAIVMIAQASGRILWRLSGESTFATISPLSNLNRIGTWLLDTQRGRADWPVAYSFIVVGATAALCLAVMIWRVRKLEEIG